jgi:hypothetical protein
MTHLNLGRVSCVDRMGEDVAYQFVHGDSDHVLRNHDGSGRSQHQTAQSPRESHTLRRRKWSLHGDISYVISRCLLHYAPYCSSASVSLAAFFGGMLNSGFDSC